MSEPPTPKQSMERHLIRPFGQQCSMPPFDVVGGREELGKAHVWIVERVLRYWSTIKVASMPYWGILEKRNPIKLAGEDCPLLVGKEEGLGEILSQMPNVERLIDLLQWAETNFPRSSIEVCHPTTSSAKGEYDLHICHRDPVSRPLYELNRGFCSRFSNPFLGDAL